MNEMACRVVRRFIREATEDETLVVMHGTTQRSAAAIRAHGFKRSDPRAMVQIVADGTGVAFDELWDSVELEFARFRTDLDRLRVVRPYESRFACPQHEQLCRVARSTYQQRLPVWSRSPLRL